MSGIELTLTMGTALVFVISVLAAGYQLMKFLYRKEDRKDGNETI